MPAPSAEAITRLRTALERDPGSLDLRYRLGCALLVEQQGAAAEEHLAIVAQQAPEHAEVWYHLGLAQHAQQRVVDAERSLRKALALAPARPEIRLVLGRMLMELGRTADEIAVLEEGVQAQPESFALWSVLARAHEDAGDAKAAEAAYRRCLALRARDGATLGSLLKLTGRNADEALIAQARALVDDRRVPDADRAAAAYGLGKVYDDRGAHRAAFNAWQKANDARRRVTGPLDRSTLEQRVNRLVETFDRARFASGAGASADERPVFVVGVPRSGTTLVEQIIAAHPSGAGVGELDAIPRFGNRPSTEPGLEPAALARDAAEYTAILDRLAPPGALRIADKQPTNFFHVGLIARLFPRAHVVWCRRDPRDACLSMWAEDLAPTQLQGTDLADLAFYFAQHERLMQHWLAVAPVSIQQVRYESLVASPEPQARALIERLGLAWDPACLDFHARTRSVTTPSRWQVRAPIHTRSIGRWRSYQEWIGPLLEAFGSA